MIGSELFNDLIKADDGNDGNDKEISASLIREENMGRLTTTAFVV